MKLILTCLLVFLSYFYSSSQSEADNTVDQFLVKNQLSTSKLEKLEAIRVTYGVESKKWKKAYQKWDKNKSTNDKRIVTDLMCIAMNRSSDCNDFGNGESFTNAYLIDLIDLRERNGNINQTTAAFYRNVFHYRVDVSDSILKKEFQRIYAVFDYMFEHSNLSIDNIEAVENYLIENFPKGNDENLIDWIQRVKTMSTDQMTAFVQFSKSLGITKEFRFPDLEAKFNFESESHMGNKFRLLLLMDFKTIAKGSTLIFNISSWAPSFFIAYETFTENDTIRQMLITSMMCQWWQNFDTYQLNSSDYGRNVLLTTNTPPSVALGMLKEYTQINFKDFFDVDDSWTPLELILTAANQGIYLMPEPKEMNAARVSRMENVNYDMCEFSVLETEILKYLTSQKPFSDSIKSILTDIENIDKLEANHCFVIAVYSILAGKMKSEISKNYLNPLVRFSTESTGENNMDPITSSDGQIKANELLSQLESGISKRLKEKGFYGDDLIIQINKNREFIVKFNGSDRMRRNIQTEVMIELFKFDHNDFPPFTQLVFVLPKVDPNRDYEQQAIVAEIGEFIQDATFPGGDAAMRKFIQENVEYPKEAKDNGENGRVHVSFIVEEDGSISDIKILRGVSPSIDAEAIRLVSKMPKWNPGTSRGKVVSSRCRLPITFTLQ